MYEQACKRLHEVVNSGPRHSFGISDWPVPINGVYFIFEAGEGSHNAERIVLIGTHNGEGNLAPRLREHMRMNKDRSVFRKHVGRALLQKDNDPYLDVWNLDFTTRQARETSGHRMDKNRQTEIETLVSSHIEERMSFTVLPTSDSVESRELARLSIGTVSSCAECNPSRDWLGQHADPRIAQSGLWQVMHLYRHGYAPSELESALNGQKNLS